MIWRFSLSVLNPLGGAKGTATRAAAWRGPYVGVRFEAASCGGCPYYSPTVKGYSNFVPAVTGFRKVCIVGRKTDAANAPAV
jgi:hypothetical protein